MGLKHELEGLYRNIERTNNTLRDLERDFWSSGGVCCPGCGVPGYSDLEDKNNRRWHRVHEIEHKLALYSAL